MAWRDYAKPIIAQVLKDTKGQPEKAIRRALKEAYPFGMRKYHPYKIWLSEIQIQRGKKKFGVRLEVVPENQAKLF